MTPGEPISVNVQKERLINFHSLLQRDENDSKNYMPHSIRKGEENGEEKRKVERENVFQSLYLSFGFSRRRYTKDHWNILAESSRSISR